MTIKRLPLLVLLLGFMAPVLSGQQVSEAEINRQKLFIDAQREKLLGNTDKAIDLFKQVLEQDPGNDGAAFELGRLYQGKEEHTEAARYLEKAMQVAPDNVWYPRYLADLYQAAGRNAEGAALYEKLVARTADDQDLYFKWAYFLVRAQDIAGAIRVYDVLEKRIGINEEISRRKHTLYLGSGDNKRAAQELVRLAEAYPRDMSYRHLLAGFYESTGDKPGAEAVYREILRVDPDDAKAQLALQSGQPAAAGDDQRYLASLQPVFERTDVDIDLKIGKLLPFITRVAETQDRTLADAALALTAVLERVHPDQAKAFAAAGDLYFHSGRYVEAQERYRATLRLDDAIYPVWEQLLAACYFTGDMLELSRTAEGALELFPNRPMLYYYLALAQDALLAGEDALDNLDQALLMTARDARLKAQVQALLAQVQAHTGQVQEAEATLLEAAGPLGDNPLLKHHRAQVLLQQDKAAAALDLAAEAAKTEPADAYLQWGYAQALYENRQYEPARAQLETFIRNGEVAWPTALERYGDVLFHLGQAEEAVRYWQLARERGSRSKTLPKKIADRQLYE